MLTPCAPRPSLLRVSVLINNAGAMLQSPFLTAEDPMPPLEMETNYFARWRWLARSRPSWPHSRVAAHW